MTVIHTVALTSLAMMAMAGNSLLTRIGLRSSTIDAASFAAIRLASGAVVLWLITSMRRPSESGDGNWPSALALFAYAACLSFAYVSLPAATGSLLLFSAVQATMIGHGLWAGEHLGGSQLVGVVLAFAGLVVLLLPGLSAPPLGGSLLMVGAGVAWGIYSLRGRGAGDPIRVTMGNFLRAVPFAAALIAVMYRGIRLDGTGVLFAVLSGAVTSGIGYSIWYTALPALPAIQAATVQLCVPLLASLGGVVFLSEAFSLRLVLASISILSGIGLVTFGKSDRA